MDSGWVDTCWFLGLVDRVMVGKGHGLIRLVVVVAYAHTYRG